MPPTVRVDVLGPLRVTVDGAGVDVRPGSARILLAWLASQQGRRLRVDACARALYPQAPPELGARKITDATRRLRRLLPDLIEPGMTLAIPAAALDLDEHRFRDALLDAGRPGVRPAAAERALTVALELWRGTPYPDLSTVLEASELIQELVEMHANAQEELTALRLRRAPDYRLVGELRDRVARDPSRERTWRQLAVALCLTGRQAEASAVIGECRSALAQRQLVATVALDDLHLAILKSETAGLYLTI